MNDTLGISLLPLQLTDVGFRVNHAEILSSISLRSTAAGVSMILGHNGAGKSMLLKLLHGLEIPTSGTIGWGSQQQSTSAIRHQQAMVFQKPVLLRRSAAANIQYVLDLPHTSCHMNCAELLDLADLTQQAKQPARSLSGGEQQRLSFARALACGPKVLFLDEPTANLDPDATLRIEKLVQSTVEQNIKVFMVTHDLAQAKRLADEIIFIRNGTLQEHSSATEFFIQPQTRYCQSFINGVLLPTSDQLP